MSQINQQKEEKEGKFCKQNKLKKIIKRFCVRKRPKIEDNFIFFTKI